MAYFLLAVFAAFLVLSPILSNIESDKQKEKMAQLKKENCKQVKVVENKATYNQYFYKCESGKEYILNSDFDL
ncbi:hypothetical protein ABH307_00700 [Acinetobacter pittii]|uniref:hypothetical protein n=1 Tax=Acinetobacter pittii TaxID=48296 RepID=UPI0032605F2A